MKSKKRLKKVHRTLGEINSERMEFAWNAEWWEWGKETRQERRYASPTYKSPSGLADRPPSILAGNDAKERSEVESGSRQARRSDSHGGEDGERDPDETVAWRLMLAWHPRRVPSLLRTNYGRADHRHKTAAQASRAGAVVSKQAASFP